MRRPSKKRNADLERELRADLELEEEEQRERGIPADEARFAARRAFGNETLIREQTREAWGWGWVERLGQDVRYALRQLARAPVFSITAVLVLAVGMGTAAAIFCFVDAALLQPLPYSHPLRLMAVNESGVQSPRWPLSYPDFLDWQKRNNVFQSMAIYGPDGYLLRTASGEEPVAAVRVSGDFFRTLGVGPVLGRDFAPGEDRLAGPNVVLLSYGTWLHRFGGRRDLIGRPIALNDTAYTVIGVLPRSFAFAPAGAAGFWVAINELSYHEQSRGFYNFWGIGRLRDGVTVEQARAEMTAIAGQIQRQYSIAGHPEKASVVPFTEIVVGTVRPILLMLLGGAGLLLLIACVNVSSLVLVRAESRRREAAVRLALGGSTGRLTQQFAAEGLLLAVFGGTAGLLLSTGMVRMLRELVPRDMAANMPFLDSAGLNGHTATFFVLVTLGAALLLTAIRRLRLSSRDVREGLADGARTSTSQVWQRLGGNLVVVELAVAAVLLASAGLLGESFYRLLHVPLGFEPAHLASLEVSIPGSQYPGDEQIEAAYRAIAQGVRGVPGVESVGMTSVLPAQCDCNTDEVHFPDKPALGNQEGVLERHVSPGYFATLRAKVLRGRTFTAADNGSAPRVAVINESFARKYFGEQDPIGEPIADEEQGRPSTWIIAGIVADVHESPLDAPNPPVEYFSVNQTHDRDFVLVARTRQKAATVLPALVDALRQVNSTLGTSDEGTVSEQIDSTEGALLHRFSAWLVGGFAAIALLLATIGLYGVIAYSVSQRTREIGVRMALGAQRRSVYALILRQAGWLSAVGLGIGLLCSVGVALLMRGLLFGIAAWDPVTLLGVALVLTAASVAASFLPARRAASVDPMQALRNE